MINVTTLDSRDDFSQRGVCPIDDTDFEDMNMTFHQRATLIELIYQKVMDEKEREMFLSSLESMSRSELTYPTDKFTPASFVSNAANVKKAKLAEIDLLPRVQYKMLMIRDLATLFSKRDDDLTEALGILTRLLDGEGLNTDSGVHGQREYNGEYLFMILAASTPIPPKVWKIMGNLGSRLFFLNMHSRDKHTDELISQLRSSAYKEKEKMCRSITRDFIQTLWYRHRDGVEWN